MLDFKNIVADEIKKVTNIENIYEYIEIPANKDMGDYSLPCFKLAKELKKAPQMIANDIKEKLKINEEIVSKVEVVNGYLNFYINPLAIAGTVLQEFDAKKESFGDSKIGNNKTIVIDYSSPNIAKPFHIGHLRSTVIGNALYNIYKFLGYNVVGINHLGDYGTQFGKLIEGYKRWGNEYDIENNPIDELTKIYVRINNLCKEDESVLEECRNNFKKLEDGDKYCTELWQKFRDLSLKEFQKVYDLLDVHFDSLNGEAFYSDKMPEIVDILEKTGKLVESEGARVINLDEYNMPPCIIEKTNGSTTYATRDLAAIMYRARTYNFDKAIYVTSYEQILHFKQVFETAKLLGLDKKYTDGLTHVPFGMVQLKTGKMSTREGNIIKLEDLLNEAISRVSKIIEEKNSNLENKEEVAKKVGIGAVIFNDLYNSRIKDEIFDWDTMLNFNGETGPYLQYMYVRTNSVLEKVDKLPEINEVDINLLQDNASVNLIKEMYNFGNTVKQAAEKNEPYIISRYLINIAQLFSSFYNENKIICEDEKLQAARIYLTYCTNMLLKNGARLLGIQMPERM
jgi:arginyl-tRNA synthetase